jgi:NadR type nicotinamide-nucleotide adenylyltransferase
MRKTSKESIMGNGNLSRVKLHGKRIGVVFGTFAPFHYGHQQEVYAASSHNDGVIVIVSGYKGDRGESVGLDLQTRFRYLREAFNDEPEIQVEMLNEDDIPRYPDGWSAWLDRLIGIVRNAVDEERHVFTIYTGEPDYDRELDARLPAYECSTDTWRHALMNRSDIPVSGTMIREDPVKNWVYINRVFRRAFTKKVLVVGASSAGKSTLVRRLARSLNAPFSEEYARKYEERMNISDDELTVPDYISFFEGQDRDNNHEVESPSNQGIVFFDTDAITTKIYASRYLPKDSRRLWEPVADVYIQKEQPDLILVVPPQRFVDDGFRSLDWADDRMQFHHDMMKELESHGFMDRVVVLDDVGTDDDADGYYARYLHAMQAVTERMDVKMMALDA